MFSWQTCIYASSVPEAKTSRESGSMLPLESFQNWTLQNAISCVPWTGIDYQGRSFKALSNGRKQ